MDAAMDVDKQNSNGSCSSSSDALCPESRTDGVTHHTSQFGTVIPNRIFVGGIDGEDNKSDLLHFFSQLGVVKEVKIVTDPSSGMPKGYGFVTFETQEEALKVLHDANGIYFKNKKLNIGQAVRKQQASRQIKRMPAVNPHQAKHLPMSCGNLYLTTPRGHPYTYHNGVAYFHCPSINAPAKHWPPAPPLMLPQSYQPVYQQPATNYCQCVPNACQLNGLQPLMPSGPTVFAQQSEYLYQPADGGSVQPPLPVMDDITPEPPTQQINLMFPHSWVHPKPGNHPHTHHNCYQYLHETAEPPDATMLHTSLLLM
ncbi:hypothetical protein Q5P01_005666 [Channa striata]|uniref:Protein boule-like n=1 Tax=Channa striata TaxID=64152 RepID=A0AA88T3A0_CHASR|nr:hypothetical protein Q5P01_005666 [Channa striata]